MLIHLIKLVWNRKRENILMMIELFFAFLVLSLLATQSYSLYERWKLPLGFDFENVWVVSYNTNSGTENWNEARINASKQIELELKSMEGVIGVSAVSMVPFVHTHMTSGDSSGILAKHIYIERMNADDEFAKTMGLKLVEGNWYDPSNEALDYRPVVVNLTLAKALYGDESPIGKQIFPRYDSEQKLDKWKNRYPNIERKQNRIIGVVEEFRKQGEFDESKYFAFHRVTPSDTFSSPPSNLLIKVRADKMTGEFEAKMMKRLEVQNPGWSFSSEALKAIHDRKVRETLTPLITFAIIGGFLIVMIALGIVGVVWQNVARRTKEIGLRRAVGSTANLIYSQVLLELLVVAVFAIIFGIIVFLQFPLLEIPFLGFIGGLEWRHYLVGSGTSAFLLIMIAFLCALYPSKVATTVAPTEALRYE